MILIIGLGLYTTFKRQDWLQQRRFGEGCVTIGSPLELSRRGPTSPTGRRDRFLANV